MVTVQLGLGMAALGRPGCIPGYITLRHGRDLVADHSPGVMEQSRHLVLDAADGRSVHHAAGFISDRLHRSLKLIFDGHTHEQLLELFHRVGKDREIAVVILAGTGGAFMDEIGPEGFDFFSPRGYDRRAGRS